VLEQPAEARAAHDLPRRDREDARLARAVGLGDWKRDVAASLCGLSVVDFTDQRTHPDFTFDTGLRLA
jgi:hypothetical protein